MTDSIEFQRDVSRFVDQNVHLCLSGLIYGLSQQYGRLLPDADESLQEQAAELFTPRMDYEEAATQAEWKAPTEHGWQHPDHAEMYPDAGSVCEAMGLDPYEWEVYEHWAVSEWFGRQLEANGERVDFDFAGLVVWARTCTGQAISMDGVVTRIYSAMMEGESV